MARKGCCCLVCRSPLVACSMLVVESMGAAVGDTRSVLAAGGDILILDTDVGYIVMGRKRSMMGTRFIC
jgi:hypothetical protein